jgi:hypothetical protein
MDKKIGVQCKCKGTGFVAVVDSVGEDVEYVECAEHNPAYQEAPSVDEIIKHIAQKPPMLPRDLFKPDNF